MNSISNKKEDWFRRYVHHMVKYFSVFAGSTMLLFLSACDSEGSKPENCTCPSRKAVPRTMAKENVTGRDIVTFACDGDIDTVEYIIDELRQDIPLSYWSRALEGALLNGRMSIAEILIKEIEKLPAEYALSKNDWNLLTHSIVHRRSLGSCAALRFIFKHAKALIEDPLNGNIHDVPLCKLQVCADCGFLKQTKQGGLFISISNMTGYMRWHLNAEKLTEEEVQFNQKMIAEAIAKTLCLLDNGIKPAKREIEFIESELNGKKGSLKREKEKYSIEMLEKMLALIAKY